MICRMLPIEMMKAGMNVYEHTILDRIANTTTTITPKVKGIGINLLVRLF